jgi:hypothetical protein
MTKTINLDHRAGITPIVIRRASYYAQLGVGEYYPTHPHFNCVRVTKLYDATQNPQFPAEWAYGLRVDFLVDTRITRWVEFSARLVGAGGDDILRKVDTNE